MTDLARFAFPTTIHFGAGAAAQVGPHLAGLGKRRPLLVTDRALAQLPVTRDFVASLRAAGLDVAVFDGVFGNPTVAQANAGGAAYRAHRADCVVGFGGGAAVDVAKIVGTIGTDGGDAIEYVWDHPKVRPIPDEVPYFVAVPTTAGTGSEVGRSSVISEDDTHVKRIVFSPKILARVVFADPLLTVGLPAPVTAATGMDALTHNVESYLSPAYHPLCDGIAVEGVRIAARALPRAVRDGGDLAARGDMLMASMMGAIAFQKDLGAVHSCAHALSTVADLHHGLANGIMIDHVMRFNLERSRGEARGARARRARPRRGRGIGRGARCRVHRLAGRAQVVDRHPGDARRLPRPPPRHARGPSRAWWTSRRRTSATRPIRAPARAADFEALFAAAL